MRLELMRLHGGAKDTRALTTSLDAARDTVDDLVRLRNAGAGRRPMAIDERAVSPA